MGITIPRYTVDDVEHFPNDGNWYELLDGLVRVTPAPVTAHQIVVSRIHARLSVAVALPGHAHVVSPGVVRRRPDAHREPDIFVYPSRFAPAVPWERITERWLAVEAFGPSSRVYDREFKRPAYLALGLREVWLVDADEHAVEVSRGPGESEIVRDVIRWRVPTLDLVVPIDLAEIFAGIDRAPRGRQSPGRSRNT